MFAPDPPQKVLVIQTAFLGDVILATSLINSLKQRFPTVRVDMVVRQGNESVLKSHEQITKVWIWKKKENKYQELIKLGLELRKEGYDSVFCLQRFAAAGFLAWITGALYKATFAPNPWSFLFSRRVEHQVAEGIHEIDRNLSLAPEFWHLKSSRPNIHHTPFWQDKTRDFIVLAPSSVWFSKTWPAENWHKVADAALDQGMEVHLVGAESDDKLIKTIQQGLNERYVHTHPGTLSFSHLAGLMSQATLVMTNDSAPLHIASAVNAPTAAVFCSTSPKFGFGPLSERQWIIETQEQLACRPCGLAGKPNCPEGHFKCAGGDTLSKALRLIKALAPRQRV